MYDKYTVLSKSVHKPCNPNPKSQNIHNCLNSSANLRNIAIMTRNIEIEWQINNLNWNHLNHILFAALSNEIDVKSDTKTT